MNINNVIDIVSTTKWFSSVGSFAEQPGRIPIRHLAAWDSVIFDEHVDPVHAAIAESMDWLPSTQSQIDPFHGRRLLDRPELSASDDKAGVATAYKAALVSLRNAEEPLLVSGSHNYVEAARGAALYCVRMSAVEVVLREPDVWCELLELYSAGHWPCGQLRDGRLVVF